MSSHPLFDIDLLDRSDGGTAMLYPGQNGGRKKTAAGEKLEEEKALHEEIKRKTSELELDLATGAAVLRQSMVEAWATGTAEIAQTLRSIGDQLEREGVPTDLCIKIEEIHTEALHSLSERLRTLAPTVVTAEG